MKSTTVWLLGDAGEHVAKGSRLNQSDPGTCLPLPIVIINTLSSSWVLGTVLLSIFLMYLVYVPNMHYLIS